MLYLSFYDQLTTYETQELEAAMGAKNHNYFIISDFLKHYYFQKLNLSSVTLYKNSSIWPGN